MDELSALFRKRIGLSASVNLTIESLHFILEKTATTIPFENFSIIEHRTSDISRENLVNKILVNNEGGLCYELNTLLYYFLIENGFHVTLCYGTVYRHDVQAFSTMERTHVTILLKCEEQTYLIDTGFGGNLPLKPVPLTGETVTSLSGESRVQQVHSQYGDYVLEQKLKHKNTHWMIGYAFDSQNPITDAAECNYIQRNIAEHPDSRFNKHRLITKMTKGGNITLTDHSFTQWDHGIMKKEDIESVRFKLLLNQYFGM